MPRIILALGGIAALAGLAAAEKYVAATIGGVRGLLGAVLLAGAVFGGCGLVHSLRRCRRTPLTRPGPVRLPEPVTNPQEPARTAA
jgi:hypothetical protein